MRRSIGLFFASLALLIQVMLPVAAAAMTRAADPLADALICSHDGAGNPTQPSDADHNHHCGVCLVCAVIHAAPLDRAVSTPAAYAAAIAVVWRVGVDSPALARFAHDGQARGPPSLI